LFATIVPFPSLPVLRVAEWFLLTWWEKRGPLAVAERLHFEGFLGG
jgi:hypothetical protein